MSILHLSKESFYAEAQYKLADLYLSGEGAPQDQSKALEWFEKSANQGNVNAASQLGNIYYNQKDYDKARD